MRPTGPCAKCLRETIPGCEHLGGMYDRALAKFSLKNPRASVLDFEQELVVYALNRMWALERDNTSKAQGNPASRIYKSRNTKGSDTLERIRRLQNKDDE